MQQIYIFIFCIWPALIVIGIFSEGMLYDPRQDSHLYSNVICKGWNNCNETVSIWYFATFEVNELIGKTCVVLRRQPKFLCWYTCWLNFEIYQLLFPVFPAQTQCGTSFTQCGGRGAGRRRASCWGVDQLRFRVVGKVLNLQGASKNCQPFCKPHFTVTLWIKFKILRSHKQQNVQNIIWLIIIPFIFRETWLGRQHFMKKTKMAFRYKQEQFSPSEGSKYSSTAVRST